MIDPCVLTNDSDREPSAGNGVKPYHWRERLPEGLAYQVQGHHVLLTLFLSRHRNTHQAATFVNAVFTLTGDVFVFPQRAWATGSGCVSE